MSDVLTTVALVPMLLLLAVGIGRAVDYEHAKRTPCQTVFTDLDARTLSDPCVPYPDAPDYGVR